MIRLNLILFLLVVLISCKNKETKSIEKNESVASSSNSNTNRNIEMKNPYKDSLVISSIEDSLRMIVKNEKLELKYIYPYTETKYTEKFNGENYLVIINTIVDTSDYIVKIVQNQNCKYVIVGYNHIYDFEIKSKNGLKDLKFRINKKKDLKYLFEKSDVWLESNLDVWSLISLKPELGISIFEYNINPRYNYGESFYFVFDSIGSIKRQGYNLSWGGEGPDGEMKVIGNFLVTCNEVYDLLNNVVLKYTKNSDISCSEFSKLPDEKKNNYYSKMRSTHAMRVLNDSAFLVIFNRPGEVLLENGLVYSFTLKELKRFKYYGLMGEMDATLLINEKYSDDTLVLYDYKRATLLFINKNAPYNITEIDTSKMQRVEANKFNSDCKVILKLDYPSFEFRKDSKGQIYFTMTKY